jgi:excisionase family DNA binding protein
MNYIDGRTAEREAFRQRILAERNYRCEKCGNGNDRKLHVHHIVARVLGGKDTDDNVLVLCPSCHTQLHKTYRPHGPRKAESWSEPQMVTIHDVAERLNLTYRVVLCMVKKGQIRHIQMSIRCIRIPVSELNRLVAEYES